MTAMLWYIASTAIYRQDSCCLPALTTWFLIFLFWANFQKRFALHWNWAYGVFSLLPKDENDTWYINVLFVITAWMHVWAVAAPLRIPHVREEAKFVQVMKYQWWDIKAISGTEVTGCRSSFSEMALTTLSFTATTCFSPQNNNKLWRAQLASRPNQGFKINNVHS